MKVRLTITATKEFEVWDENDAVQTAFSFVDCPENFVGEFRSDEIDWTMEVM